MRGLITSSVALLPCPHQSAPSVPYYPTQWVRSSFESGFGQDVTSYRMAVDEIYIREFQVNIPYDLTDWTKIYNIRAKNEKVREEDRDYKAIKKTGGLGSLPLYILERWIRFSINVTPRLKTVSIIHPFCQFFIRGISLLHQKIRYWFFFFFLISNVPNLVYWSCCFEYSSVCGPFERWLKISMLWCQWSWPILAFFRLHGQCLSGGVCTLWNRSCCSVPVNQACTHSADRHGK